MSGPDGEDSLPCVTQQSADKLKFTISFAGSKGHSSEGRSVRDSDVASEVTSRNLFLVLSDVHSQLVRRDPKGIFAHPVTDDIAAGYSKTISHPMDMGTIYDRLCSRAFYTSASEYLADVTLMCENAMVYNPPDTIYYQRARKLLAYCRKQMTPPAIRKLCDQLDLVEGLKDSELGDVQSPSDAFARHHKLSHSHHHHRRIVTGSNESLIRGSSRISLGSSIRPDRSWHGAQRISSNPGMTRHSSSRVNGGHGRRSLYKVSQLHHTDQSFVMVSASSPSSPYPKRKRKSSHAAISSPTSETANQSPAAESTSHFHKSDSILSSSPSKSRHQPTGRPRGRPRKTPRPSVHTPTQLATTESDNSLPNSPPHLSTVSSSSPSSTSVSRRNNSYCCPSPMSSSARADSPTARSTSAGSDALSTNASANNTPIEIFASTGPSTPTTSAKSPELCAQISSASVAVSDDMTTSTAACSVLDQSAVSTSSTVQDASPTGSVKRGRGRPPKWPRPNPTDSEALSKTSPQKRILKRPMSGSRSVCPSKRRSAPQSSPSPVTDEEEVEPELEADIKPPVQKSDMTTQVEDEVLDQARAAAERAAARLRAKYAGQSRGVHGVADRIGPRLVYFNCDTPGQVTAIACPWAESSMRPMRMDLGQQSPHDSSLSSHIVGPVHLPSVLNQVLTGYRSRDAFAPEVDLDSEAAVNGEANPRKKPYVPLVDPFNASQLEDLRQLGKLKYNVDEPLAAAIHGPLAVFSPEELGQMAEVYGGDPNVMEYAFSLLTFVEPMGPWARRWAARQLDLATDGLHSQCAQMAKYPYLKDENSSVPSFNWMHTARLTIDSPSPPCSPEPNEQIKLDEDDSCTPFLERLGPVDPAVLLSVESVLPTCLMDGQGLFLESAEPSTEQVSTDPVDSETTNVPGPVASFSCGSQAGAQLVISVTTGKQTTPPTASIVLPTVSTSTIQTNSHTVPLCTAANTDTTVTFITAVSSTESGLQLDSAKNQRVNNTLESSSENILPSFTNNSLLKSVLHGVEPSSLVTDRSASLHVGIPISPTEGTNSNSNNSNNTCTNGNSKPISRLDSLVQHSPQVTLPSELRVSPLSSDRDRSVELQLSILKDSLINEGHQKIRTLTKVSEDVQSHSSLIVHQSLTVRSSSDEKSGPTEDSIPREQLIKNSLIPNRGSTMTETDVLGHKPEEMQAVTDDTMSLINGSFPNLRASPIKVDDSADETKLIAFSDSRKEKSEPQKPDRTKEMQATAPVTVKVKPERLNSGGEVEMNDIVGLAQSTGRTSDLTKGSILVEQCKEDVPDEHVGDIEGSTVELLLSRTKDSELPIHGSDVKSALDFGATKYESFTTDVVAVVDPSESSGHVMDDLNSSASAQSRDPDNLQNDPNLLWSKTSGDACIGPEGAGLKPDPMDDQLCPRLSARDMIIQGLNAPMEVDKPLMHEAFVFRENVSIDSASVIDPIHLDSVEPLPVDVAYTVCVAQFAPPVVLSLYRNCEDQIDQLQSVEACVLESVSIDPLVLHSTKSTYSQVNSPPITISCRRLSVSPIADPSIPPRKEVASRSLPHPNDSPVLQLDSQKRISDCDPDLLDPCRLVSKSEICPNRSPINLVSVIDTDCESKVELVEVVNNIHLQSSTANEMKLALSSPDNANQQIMLYSESRIGDSAHLPCPADELITTKTNSADVHDPLSSFST